MAFFFFFDNENICDFVKSIFLENGFDCNVSAAVQPKGLPLYMVKNRGFFNACVEGVRFVVVAVLGEESFDAEALARQIKKYEQVLTRPVAFLFKNSSNAQRKSLIQERVPFIAPTSLIYLPFLGVALQNQNRAAGVRNKDDNDLPKKMTPQGQQLFLYMLYKVKDSYVTKARAAQETGLNAMAVSRYSRELEKLGLVRLQENGRSILMTCTDNGASLVEKAKPYLINPIKKRIIVTKDNLKEAFPKAGETALSAKTMLTAPRIDAYACQKKDLSPNAIDYTADLRWFSKLELIEVQIWSYNPSLFAVDGVVDPLSLYMSLKESKDERVVGCLEEMMETVQW